MTESTEAKVSDGVREAVEEIDKLVSGNRFFGGTAEASPGPERIAQAIQRLAVAPVEAERDNWKTTAGNCQDDLTWFHCELDKVVKECDAARAAARELHAKLTEAAARLDDYDAEMLGAGQLLRETAAYAAEQEGDG